MDNSATIENPLELSEEQKRLDNYLKSEIDYTINLCNDASKKDYQRAYDLRNGTRSEEKFKYLWEAYGLEFPSELRHVPVLKSMFDALVGQERLSSLNYTITSKNPSVIKKIHRKRAERMVREILNRLERNIENNVNQAVKQSQGINTNLPQPNTNPEQELAKVEEEFSKWKSELEINSSDLMEWLIQSMRLKFHFGTFLDDLICAGQCYYQVKPVQVGRRPLFRVINPLGFFYPDDPNIRYVKDHERAVYREEMTVTQIFNQFGHKMTESDRKEFIEQYKDHITSNVQVSDTRLMEVEARKGKRGKGMTIPKQYVYYVEWKANNKIEYDDEELMVDSKTMQAVFSKKKKHKYRLDLYEGVRIGDGIYVDYGKSKYPRRPVDDPGYCYLSFNGLCYNDRNGKPYSLVLKTEDLADKIDIFHYHAESLVAMSGTKAVLVNFPDIPIWLGDDKMQRVMKWVGLVKQGAAILDTSQESDGAGKFNNSGDVDLTLDSSIKVIFDMIAALEETASKITGVSRHAIGALHERDGKGVTEMAMTRSTVVTQPLFSILNEVQREALTDLLDASSICYKDGITSSYRDDNGTKIFDIKPGELLSDNDVHVSDSGEESQAIEKLQSIAADLAVNQIIDAENIVDLFTIKSLTKLKQKIVSGIRNRREDKTAELEEMVKQYQGELAKLQKELENTKGSEGQLKQAELELKAEEVRSNRALKEKELAENSAFNSAKLALEEKRVELEGLELAYTDNAKEVRND